MMNPKSFLLCMVALACASLMLASCESLQISKVKPSQGPPPHAPAHGYRAKQPDGVALVFDSGLGVYVVAGREDHYFKDEKYYRYRSGAWEVSVRLEGPWMPTSEDSLPPGLRGKAKIKGKGKHSPGQGKGHQKGR